MSKKYIRQIMKRLKCSKSQREEIKKQLISEIKVVVETGENEQDVMKRMGTPAEIAEEFNSSFSEEEKKKYRKEKWKKRIAIIVSIIVIVAGIIWWMLPKQIWIEDSKIFNEEMVMEQAELVIEYLDADDYVALKEISDEKMKAIMDGDELSDIKAEIGTDWGEQQSVGNVYIVELTQKGRKSAVVQMHVTYENQTVLYTVFFNRNMELEGLWMQ